MWVANDVHVCYDHQVSVVTVLAGGARCWQWQMVEAVSLAVVLGRLLVGIVDVLGVGLREVGTLLLPGGYVQSETRRVEY